MVKTLLAIISSFMVNICMAQDSVKYVAARTGLSLRAEPSVNGKLLAKLQYGEKISIESYSVETDLFTSEGFESKWVLISANGRKGYVASAFLFPFPPPAVNTKTLKDYLNQLSKAACTVKYGEQNEEAEENFDARSKTLYKNGAEIVEEQGYEWSSRAYVLPKFDIQNAFLLLRLIPEFSQFLEASSEFPLKSHKTNGVEVNVYKDEKCNTGFRHCIEKLVYTSQEQEWEELQIFEINSEMHIIYNTGV